MPDITQVLYAPRLGREGELRIGCCGILFNETHDKVFLTQRTDNERWCLPGGRMESGESAAETCEREFFEETGIRVRATRLIGVYSNPDQLVIYPDGNKVFMIVLSFEVEKIEGNPTLSNETIDFGFFSTVEMESMPMHGEHKSRAEDAFVGGNALIK